MREVKHITKREEVPTVNRKTRSVDKKVIQPIIKDVIQPIQLRINPVLQNGLKPTIFKGKEVKEAIDKGIQNLPSTYDKTEYEKEIREGGTQVRESIIRSNSLPVIYKSRQLKPEINLTTTEAVRTDVFKHISGGTVVRPSIVRNNVLPTINQGVTVLKTIYGGTTRSVDKTGTTVQINNNINVINQQYGATSRIGVLSGAVPSPTIGQFNDVGFKPTGSIMGVDRRIGDYAADITYTSIRPSQGALNKSIVMPKVNNPIVGTYRHNSPDIAYSRAQRAGLGATTNNTIIASGATPNVVKRGSFMDIDGIKGDNSANITYTANPTTQNIALGPTNNPIITSGVTPSNVIGNNNVVGLNGRIDNTVNSGQVIQGMPLGVNGVNTQIV